MLVLISEVVVERRKVLDDLPRGVGRVVNESQLVIDFQFFLLSVFIITNPFSEWRNIIISGYSLRGDDGVTVATSSLDSAIFRTRAANLRLLDVF